MEHIKTIVKSGVQRFTLMFMITLLFASNSFAQKPKLIVGIVVDQMRVDYLTRYESKFGESIDI